LWFDADTNTTFWRDAIGKEMSLILPAVKMLDKGAQPPFGFQQIQCHIVFDTRIDFTRKAQFVAGGHVTSPPVTQTYASVVSRESVWIAFLLVALNNNMEVLLTAIQVAYLIAPCHEICGMEFGVEHVGKVVVIIKALYGLKTTLGETIFHKPSQK
jgi:hypothetical protein